MGWEIRVQFRWGMMGFLCLPPLGLTRAPIQCIPEARTAVIKRPKRKADHSPASSSEINNAWSRTSSPPIRLRGVVHTRKLSTRTTLPRVLLITPLVL
jgi:hypothetical protein